MDSRFPARTFAHLAALAGLGVACLTVPATAQVTAVAPAAAAQAETETATAPPQPTAQDRHIARLIAQLIPKYHISTMALNDEISERALDLYLDRFDPLKLYFYQSDIDQFKAYKDKIDDMVKKGDLTLAYSIFNRFTQRVDERVAVALELLDSEFDFSKEDYIIVDAEAAQYANSPEEARERWRRQIKYALLDLRDDGTEGDEARDLLRRRYKRYARRFKTYDNDDLLEAYLTSVTSAFDPHSTYMSPSTLDDFNISMGLKLQGIGAALREKDGNTVVMQVIPGGAASLDERLQPDDVIVSVGQGESGEMVDIVEMPLQDVVSLIRGNAGTVVRLGVKVGGKGTLEIYKLVRAQVELEQSAARGKIIDHEMPDGTKQKIGFINLPSFYMDMQAARENQADFRSSTRDVRRILMDFKTQGVQGVVIDLSRNGGGSLTEAINLTGLFINRGPVVQVKDSGGQINQYNDEEPGTVWSGPLVVQTSKFSASASEIFAGAIKDYNRGIIVGDPQTHGKGTVQTLMDLAERLFGTQRANYGALKVTLQQFYLPDGESTQRDGVAADIVLPSLTQKMDVAEGDLKYALETDRIDGARHDIYNLVPTDLLTELRQKSEQRVKADDEFIDLIRRIALFVKQKDEDTVPLEETAFMERRKELDAQKEEEKEELEQETDQEVYRDTFYNREVMNITGDYIEGLQRQQLVQSR
ncbi:carboxy terminal-processing peptidase [Stieleria sp. TO1_6]|uniref:carboxy terminal-processing peptidase n=1 Tax=Stieleria tagensis TaxID=2956795 RepID=UPI00209B461A|nr:carboxy terminal-processing peptidase [Stieleria tagensis]MCO8124069.1 carboxy terminal-processing peptidase [Stieleria tagensis]